MIRIAVGVVWGLGLYGLRQLAEAHWPTAHPVAYAALLLSLFYWPLILLTSIGALRPVVALIWGPASLAVLAALGGYGGLSNVGALLPVDLTPQLILASGLALFIGHRLVAGGDAERRLVASYERYFDLSWKAGLQWVMAALFTGVFWALLFLGAALFALIHLTFLMELIRKSWFALPATTTSFAGALHLTDVRVGLVRGVRTVLLTLLGWLLPLITGLAVCFLAALPFTGLAPLWNTKAAAGILLTALAWLILLINITFQDGRHAPPELLKWSARIAALSLPILAGLAAYAIWIRFHQYGWTPQRVFASATMFIACCYALGYALAAIAPGRWLKILEPVNVAIAYVVIAVVFLLFSPLGDPARISVTDQVARLRAGAVSAAKFDYAFLRFHAGVYGRDALVALKAAPFGPDAQVMRNNAEAALKRQNPWNAGLAGSDHPLSTARLTVYPKGAAAPVDLLTGLPNASTQPCLDGVQVCDLFMIDFDGDGQPEAALGSNGLLSVFKHEQPGHWVFLGTLNLFCAGDIAAMRAGRYRLTPSDRKDIVIDGRRIAVASSGASCPMPVGVGATKAP
jgi:hypothetical protein